MKESLFELHNWSRIYCPEAKQSDAALQRRQTMQVENNLQNGVHGWSKSMKANKFLCSSDASNFLCGGQASCNMLS